jgi:antitoxin StbD
MESVLANCSVSISELKKNPSALIEQSGGEPIAILNHNKPTAYLIPAATYEALMEKIEDYQLGLIVNERQHEKISAVEVTLDELIAVGKRDKGRVYKKAGERK